MRDPWLTAIVVFGLLCYAVWTALVVQADRPVDYYTYAVAADALAHGDNIYQDDDAYAEAARRLGIASYQRPYQYPLLTAALVWPLTLLPARAGAALWVFANGAAALVASLLLGAPAWGRWRRRLVVLALLGFVPVITTMYAGQVNGLVLLAVAATIAGWRRGRDGAAAAAATVGAWLKLFPLALLGLAIWRGRRGSLAGALVAGAAVALLCLAAFGPAASRAQLQVGARVGEVSGQVVTYPPNQSLGGLLGRWLAAHPYGPPLAEAPLLGRWLTWGLGAALALALLALLWPPGRRARPLEMEAALLIVTLHLVAPLTWYHHLTLAFVGVAALLGDGDDPRRRRGELAALGLAYLLIALQGLAWRRFVGYVLLLDWATWGTLILWGLLARRVWLARRATW